MHDSPIKIRDLILAFLFSLIIIICLFFGSYFNRTTKIVFRDVGQGDAAYIRIKNKIDVLIDAGPDKKILNCLGRHMPFWDRKIELVILSHPNKDHYAGFSYIIERYKLDMFITVNPVITSKSYKKLVSKIIDKKIRFQYESAGDKIKIDQTLFDFYWPPGDFKSYQDNDYSLVFLFEENDFRLLFTGDASPKVLNSLYSLCVGNKNFCSLPVNILKIPHHGSRTGLTKKFLELADPMIAVISVGKNNSYGHPSKEVLDMLKAQNVKIKRTDVDGDIVFNLKE